MNKKILFVIIVLILIIVTVSSYWFYRSKKDGFGCLINQGYSWCDFKQECVKSGEGNCVLTADWIIQEAKKIIGLDLNTMLDQAIEYNTKDGKAAFSAKGIYYSDLLKAEKVIQGFEQWKSFLEERGLYNIYYNLPTRSEEKDDIKLGFDNIICALGRVDNPNNTSSLSLFCGDIRDKLYNFDDLDGKRCAADNDCDLVTNGCALKIVCRTKGLKFYNACQDPSSLVSELDTAIGECICLENQCVPKNEKYRDRN